MSFKSLYDFFGTGGGQDWIPLPALPDWAAFLLAGFVLAFSVINVVILSSAFYTWFERRVLGRFQSRLGPNRWGPFGLFQPFADLIKLITKEDIIPDDADRPVATLAPIVLLVPAFVVVAVIPFGEDSFLGHLNIGVLFILGITGINTFGIFMGGWASKNKYAMFGAMRGVAMLISYEVPMALSLVGVVLMSGTMSLSGIVEGQNIPFALVQPLAFLVFITAASAEMSRTPFDMIESESELGSGYHTEFGGIKWAIFQQAEFTAPLVTALITTVLFLGGTRGFDPVPGQVWFLVKTFLVVYFLIWFRVTWPRLRVDQIMVFAWKGLFPLSLLNIFLVAFEMQFLGSPEVFTGGELWAMAALNWVVTIVAVVVTANLLGQPRLKSRPSVPSPLANMNLEAD